MQEQVKRIQVGTIRPCFETNFKVSRRYLLSPMCEEDFNEYNFGKNNV